jgi:CRP-like cAMP-binding protein
MRQFARMEETTDHRPLTDFIARGLLAAAIEKQAHPIKPSTGGLLFREGDEPEGVYFLKTGEAMLTMKVAGKTMLSVRVSAGSLLGLPAIMANRPYSLSATAEKQAEVYRIESEDFKEMIHQDSRLCLEVLRILACEVHSARSALGVRLGQACADDVEN